MPARTRHSDVIDLMDYQEIHSRINAKRSYLLLGNGFSIACDPVFRYSSLYESAVAAGLSSRAQLLFERIGTNNFEGVMRLLGEADWMARTYGLVQGNGSQMLEDLEVIKRTLVQAVANSHLEQSGDIEESRKQAAATFFAPYHIVFTTNYDLLPYWVVMAMGNPPPLEDCFRADQNEPDVPYLVFSQRLKEHRGLLHLHGALHLYLEDGELRKHSWARTGRRLTDLIREGLEQRQFPLFVAEGTPEQKLRQIQGNGYLWYCLERLRSIQSPLVIFGHSFGSSDGHILDAIALNIELPEIFVGLHGDPESPTNQSIQAVAQLLIVKRARHSERRKYRPLQVRFYSSDSVPVWG
jgi:hypothetical protein